MTLKERAILAKEALAKQPSVTYEQLKAQIERLKAASKEQHKKTKS